MNLKLIAVICAVVIMSCPIDAVGGEDHLVEIGTHRLHMHSDGGGTPEVVIDTGLGDLSANWRAVQVQLAKQTRVITYDRGGYGSSDPGPMPRSALQIAAELHALLESAHVKGPVILVGHSLGGLNVQVFANRYSDRVAGLILLDPPPLGWITGECFPDLRIMAEAMTQEWEISARRLERSAESRDNIQANFFRTIASEHREMFGASAVAASIESFGTIPLLVIAAGRPNPMFGDVAEEYQRYWIEENRALAKKSSRGAFILLHESTHHLYRDEPDRIVESILSMVSAIRDRMH